MNIVITRQDCPLVPPDSGLHHHHSDDWSVCYIDDGCDGNLSTIVGCGIQPCKNCGKPILVQIRKNTGICSENCEKAVTTATHSSGECSLGDNCDVCGQGV